MSKIAYDPTKDIFARWVRRSRLLRTVFYMLLDLFFLRSWYVRSVLRVYYPEPESSGAPVKLLDAGSGFGQYDRFLLKTFPGIRIHAVDIKEDYLQDCTSYFQPEIESGKILIEKVDLVTGALPESAYDLALCVDVLEHIQEDQKVMSKIARGLKPGGFFIMHSPSHYSEQDAGPDEFFVDEHARAGYSREELRQKIFAAGLEPVVLRYTYGKWGHRAWKFLIKWPMLWFTRWGMLPLVWLPFYYAFALPPGIVMMYADMKRENSRGTGILGVASKPQRTA